MDEYKINILFIFNSLVRKRSGLSIKGIIKIISNDYYRL